MRSRTQATNDILTTRIRFLVISILFIFFCIIIRLFFWQVLESSNLQAAAEEQYQREITNQGERGTIFTSDGKILVTNTKVYRLFAQPHLIKDPEQTAITLNEILGKVLPASPESPTSLSQDILTKVSAKDKKWIRLFDDITEETKIAIQEKKLAGIGFDEYLKRSYPEASMAAHITGFVGKNEQGADTGYFGIEGALEKELKARQVNTIMATDALGQQLISDSDFSLALLNGRDITTTIRRDLQHLAETSLAQGIEKYQAKAGEVIIMDPKTGSIRALATYPSYDQSTFSSFPGNMYKNPSITDLYEPGSTFKVLTVAAGLDTKKISPNTTCPICAGPRTFGKYTIKTWNDQYNPNITMTDALAKSDNTAMIYIAEQLGSEIFQKYLKNFGIGEKLHVEIQEDTATPFPTKWGPVELATTSFGQGISTNSLQLVRAIGTIANQGIMMRPRIIEKVVDPTTQEIIEVKPMEERRVISSETATSTTQMMVSAANSGEAQWIRSKTHTIAGKTGTSQIASNGSYDPDKTIASFIGFAPADDPQFVMLVKLVEPQSSIWAAETAAPLWYSIADRLFILLNIPADKSN